MSVTTALRPRFEGANIRTWIGFKHLMYLAEEAMLSWLREHAMGARELYHARGLGVEVVDASVQLPALLELDDEVIAETDETRPGRFSVRLRAGARAVLNGRIDIALVRETQAATIHEEWRSLVVDDVAALASDPQEIPLHDRDARTALEEHGFYWPWQARYFHCNYSDRVQHSAYVRALEEVVDRFLADRGLGIRRLLAERAWIPVVSRARVRSLAGAHMDEIIHTTFVVDDVLKRAAYDGRMDCWVERAGTLRQVATARILHGYAISAGPDAGKLAELDDDTIAALRTGGGVGS